MAKRSWAYKYSDAARRKKSYTDAQRAAYWKKKYIECLKFIETLR